MDPNTWMFGIFREEKSVSLETSHSYHPGVAQWLDYKFWFQEGLSVPIYKMG